MFNLSKKINPEKDKNLENEAEGILNPAGAENDNKTTIHVMPKKFLNAHAVNNKAQKTGLIIISAGFVFLIVIGFTLYFFLFKANNNPSGLSPIATSTNETIQDRNNPAENTPDISNSGASASSTLPALIGETATTTVYVEEPVAPSATTTEANANVESSSATGEILAAGKDSDSDSLTDEEEKILGTSNDKRDSDSDGYEDRAELLSLYNPAGAGKLSVNSGVKQYFNKTYNYNLVYPYNWSQTNIDGDNSVVFKADNGQFFQVIVMPNNNNADIEEWYKAQFWDGVEKYKIIFLGELKAVKSENGLMFYLTDKERKNVYAFTYNLGLGKILEYQSLFETMVKSFEISG